MARYHFGKPSAQFPRQQRRPAPLGPPLQPLSSLCSFPPVCGERASTAGGESGELRGGNSLRRCGIRKTPGGILRPPKSPENFSTGPNTHGSRINTGDSTFAQKHFGGRFWRPPNVLPVTLPAYFFFAVFLAAFFAGFFATAFLVAIVSILPLSSRHRTCKYFAVNECIESQKNSVKKKIAFYEDQFAGRNR
jgi:hypothetical protein